jgi:hypothetical protein
MKKKEKNKSAQEEGARREAVQLNFINFNFCCDFFG